jgi:hypothetical protein
VPIAPSSSEVAPEAFHAESRFYIPQALSRCPRLGLASAPALLCSILVDVPRSLITPRSHFFPVLAAIK